MRTCTACGGSGYHYAPGKTKCWYCTGAGQVSMAEDDSPDEYPITTEWSKLVQQAKHAIEGHVANEVCSLKLVDELEDVVVRLRKLLETTPIAETKP